LKQNSIFIQGDATVSRKQTVGISTPVLAGNPGDITYNANPEKGSNNLDGFILQIMNGILLEM